MADNLSVSPMPLSKTPGPRRITRTLHSPSSQPPVRPPAALVPRDSPVHPPNDTTTTTLPPTGLLGPPPVRLAPLPRIVDSARSTHIVGGLPPPSRGCDRWGGGESDPIAARRALLRDHASSISCFTSLLNRVVVEGSAPHTALDEGGVWRDTADQQPSSALREVRRRCHALSLPPLYPSDDGYDSDSTADASVGPSPTEASRLHNQPLGAYFLTEPLTRSPTHAAAAARTAPTRRRTTTTTTKDRSPLPPLANARSEGYVSTMLAALRDDPEQFAAFERQCDDAARTAALLSRRARDLVKENYRATSHMSRSEHIRTLKERSEQRQSRLNKAKMIRESLSSSAEQHTSDARRARRREQSQLRWLPIVALAARIKTMTRFVDHKRAREQFMVQTNAAFAIQHAYLRHRKGLRPITVLQAFCIRARFLRRVLTVRVRVRLRARYTMMIKSTLQTIVKRAPLMPIFVAMKTFALRMLRVQRHFRRRRVWRMAVIELRERQWMSVCEARVAELQDVIRRGRIAGADAVSIADASSAVEEINRINAISSTRRRTAIEEFSEEYRSRYNASLTAWQTARSKQQPSRLVSSSSPRFGILIPSMTLLSLITRAARENRRVQT